MLDNQVAICEYNLYEPVWWQDAQNSVAAFALCHLFPDLPVHLLVTEPYASLVMQWEEGDSFSFSKMYSWKKLKLLKVFEFFI